MEQFAIPTVGPRGIEFRSRLEAKWAYFFESLNWKWEYEPFDLAGYIPDFVLLLKSEEDSSYLKVLVEVKPELEFKELHKHLDKIRDSGWEGNVLIVGARLFEGDKRDWPHCFRIGMFFTFWKGRYGECSGCKFCESDGKWCDRELGYHKNYNNVPASRIDDFSEPKDFYIHAETANGVSSSFWALIDKYCMEGYGGWKIDAGTICESDLSWDFKPRSYHHYYCDEQIEQMWADATNNAQWKPKRQKL